VRPLNQGKRAQRVDMQNDDRRGKRKQRQKRGGHVDVLCVLCFFSFLGQLRMTASSCFVGGGNPKRGFLFSFALPLLFDS